MSWKDRQYKRQSEMVVPFIQWVNNGGSLEPRNDGGGFAMPLDQAAILGVDIPGDARALHHRGGNQTEMIFTPVLDVAVLATRFTWVKNKQSIPDYETGARGKLQALALVRDADGNTAGPALLTFRGYASKQFGAALKAHREAVLKATANQAPAYAFFGAFRAGEVKMVGNGQKSAITTIELADDGFDADAAYVGDAELDALDWNQVDAWADAWKQSGGADGDGDGESNDRGRGFPKSDMPASKPQSASPQVSNAPASKQQMGEIHDLLRRLNYEAARHNEVIRKSGYDPDNLAAEQATSLISRLKKAAAKKSS